MDRLLKDIVSVKGRVGWKGYTVDDLRDEGPWVIGANDITTDHKLVLNNAKHISRQKYEESPEIWINKNDILVVKVGSTIGKVAIVNFDIGEACINPNAVLLKDCSENPYYLYYYLKSDLGQKYLLNNSSASAQSALNQDNLKKLPIYFPSYKIQDAIVDVVTPLDDKIELNNRINAQLEQMAKTLYDYWFVQFDFPNAEGKPYKSSGAEMVYSVVLKREIPKGWEVKSLYQIANFINGLACQKFRPENENDDYLPVIKIREMNDGISSNTERVRINIPSKNIINDGDVLFSWSATLDVKIWCEGKAALNQHIFKVTSDKYPRSFYYFETLNYLQHFKMMAELRKTTMGHITIDHLKDSFIPIPPIELIAELDKKLNILLEKIVSNKKQNQQLSQLRDWLLPMLMNGQVTVGEAEEMVEGLGMVAEERGDYKKH